MRGSDISASLARMLEMVLSSSGQAMASGQLRESLDSSRIETSIVSTRALWDSAEALSVERGCQAKGGQDQRKMDGAGRQPNRGSVVTHVAHI